MHKLSYLRNLPKIPIQLLNPDEELLYVVNKPKNAKLTFRDNNISELTFDIYKNRNGKKVIYYDLLTKNRLLKIDDVHIFMIDGVSTNSDGSNEIKTITAKSVDYLLTKKTIPYINSTYKFYDLINPANTLMGLIMSYLPSWSIESIDAELYDIYRTFDSENENIYNFIVDKVQPAYECVFRFDTINRKIRVDKYDTRLKTDVYLSFNNAIKELNATLLTDRFATALNVKGAGDLTISYVNPMGTSIMYNLDYYMFHVDNDTGEYFVNNSMRSAYSTWKSKYDGYLITYGTKLTNIKTKKDELLVLENALSTLQGDLKVIENNIDMANKIGDNASTYVAQRQAKLTEIKNKKSQITAKENEITTIENELTAIHNDLKFENNFTSEQMKTLDFLIDIATVVDENFAISSSMTASEKQDIAQQLYDKNKRTLDRISKPRYSFSINSTNILFIDKFLPFVNQLELGSEITIRDNNDNLFNPILLEVTIDLENPKNIDWKFSESIRLSDDVIDVNEILGNVSNTQMTINSKMTQFIEYARNDKVNIYNYMNNGLRADVQEISNTINQEVTMNERGILCRLWLANESDYDNKQLKITNNRIMMTKDNWVTAENCFGEFTMPDGTKVFGLIGNVLVGNILIGNNLLIENSSGTFSVNKDGMTVTDMTMTLTNDKNRIILNSTDVFKIQKKVSGNWTDLFKIDSDGNLSVTLSGYATTTDLNNAKTEAINSANSSTDGKLASYSTTTQMNTAISASANGLLITVNQNISTAKTEAINSANSSTDSKLVNYSTTTQMSSAINLSASNLTATFNQTLTNNYSTTTQMNKNISTAKTEAINSANSSTDSKLVNYSTTTQMSSAINLSASNLTATFNQTLTNNYSTTTQMNSAISVSATSLTSTFTSQINATNANVSTVTQTASNLSVAINNTKVTIDSSVGITIKNGGLRILNNSNDETFRITSGGAIEMQGELYNLYGQLGVRLYQGKVDFTAGNSASTQTWFTSTVGSIYGYYYDQISTIRELIIAGYNRTTIKSSYNSSVYYQMNTVYNSAFIGHDFYGNIRINNYITFGGKQFKAVKAGTSLTSSDYVMVGR